MFTRILTELERRRIQSYLKRDGEKESAIRTIATRARQNMPTIRSDLELLEKLLQTYAVR
jgi:hypothetical protein